MPKITKREYNSRKSELLNKMQQTEIKLTAVEKQIDDPNYTTLPDSEKILINSEWESLFDRLYDLKKEMEALDDEWDRRDWTYSDYAQYNLIANNID